MKNLCFLDITFVARMLLACICGIAIGYERKSRSKEAGIRTHCVVACSAAIMMIISKYGFTDVADIPGIRGGGADPSRIASQVVSGISFLGAGMIFIQRSTITGLTTAAGIWATAGIGMAIGSGMYSVGIAGTIIILVAQIVFHKNFKFLKTQKLYDLLIYDVNEDNFQENMKNILSANNIFIHETSIEKSIDNTKNYVFTIDFGDDVLEDKIISLAGNYKCKLKIKG